MASLLLSLLTFALGAAAALPRRDLPSLPLSSDDGWIHDAAGNRFPFVGINWPAHEKAMIPEGLQHQSIASIVSRVSETGFNSVRLTFATEMVDDILDRGGDVSLRAALATALGAENGTRVLDSILEHNPSFDADTTRLEVFDAVAAELARRDILVHLDNHVSKAGWCCAADDGNGWWGDQHFNASSWVRGLAYMAEHGKDRWPSFSSVGLRNELRQGPSGGESYTWQTWKDRMLQAAEAVHAANPDLLIFFGGRLFSFDLAGAVDGRVTAEPDFRFSVAELPFANRFVFEQHQYDQGQVATGDCATYYFLLGTFGSNAPTAPEDKNRAPLVMSEWGHDQSDDGEEWNGTFRRCIADYMVKSRVGWMMWVLGGSYYVREGEHDRDEPWGLLDHEWGGYRGTKALQQLQTDIKRTYDAFNQTASSSKSTTQTAETTATREIPAPATPTVSPTIEASPRPDDGAGTSGIPVILALFAAVALAGMMAF
ncbi:glycoside hydrolase superfamily [Plectosphaerella cucumerina]|uniref:Glycoside hydrolase superfamily n=1 Tax=Plectosphaerella cucumerina TaxID=40658 RepID=A0A8K0TCI2_9PEZI|nr:glycoside hydrolase superfamily [Plectosphaerella cucumerina]